MTNYARLYRLGIAPWEPRDRSGGEHRRLLDREEKNAPATRRGTRPWLRPRPIHPELAQRGWRAVGIDNEPARNRKKPTKAHRSGATYAWDTLPDLLVAGLGTFDFFLDVGCFQGLKAEKRDAQGQGVTALANLSERTVPDARFRMDPGAASLVEGVSQQEVEDAFPDWEMLAVHSAATRGLGWPMNRWKRPAVPTTSTDGDGQSLIPSQGSSSTHIVSAS